jgi:hypothetical protein
MTERAYVKALSPYDTLTHLAEETLGTWRGDIASVLQLPCRPGTTEILPASVFLGEDDAVVTCALCLAAMVNNPSKEPP